MKQIQLKIPPGFEQAISLSGEELEHELLLMAALKLFELGKISSRRAAELIGISRVDFFELCGRYHVSIFNYSDEVIESELRSDLENFKSIILNL